MQHLIVGWKVSTLTAQVASVRYRALMPILALENPELECRIFSAPYAMKLEELDILVLVKSLGIEDYALAQRAYAKGIPLVLDLCDNIFLHTYGQPDLESHLPPATAFIAMARFASAIVVSTDALADQVRLHCNTTPSVFVIPDCAETPALRHRCSNRLLEARRTQLRHALRSWMQGSLRSYQRMQDYGWRAWDPLLRRVEKAVKPARLSRLLPTRRDFPHQTALIPISQRHSIPPDEQASLTNIAGDHRCLLWFGFHGAEHASFGMLDLLIIKAGLEQIALEFDVELVVVSNHREKYKHNIQPLQIRTRYREWTAAAVDEELAKAALVLVPNSQDAFSLCKSANRTVLSLNAGVPVVATMTPALRVLSDGIQSSDFLDGMRLYLSDATRAKHDVQRAQELIRQNFSSARIAALWQQTLLAAFGTTAVPLQPKAELLVSIHLIMDIALAVPLIRRAIDMNIAVLVLCNSELRKPKPDLEEMLQLHGADFLFVHTRLLDRNFQFPKTAAALLTFSESNLRPHTFNHQLTRMANQAGIATFTLQHGFENIGLTYDDAIQPIRSITFAAQHIFIWGGELTLHPAVPNVTRRKCVSVGCPKPLKDNQTLLSEALPPTGPVIGIFENLHWRRYPDTYRQNFLDNVLRVAIQLPEVVFLLKPHNAGLWLTKRFRGALPAAPNLLVVDPQSPPWISVTAANLFWRCSGIITTPSTVAMDAARHGLPVAVVADNLNLDNYAPLPLLRTSQDWQRFAADAIKPSRQEGLLELAQQFCQRVVLPEGADVRILQAMFPERDLRPTAQ